MGLNPGESRIGDELRRKILDDNFNSGSPYFGMFWAGYYGIDLDTCIDKCRRNGIPLRNKDIRSYQDGAFKRGVGHIMTSQGVQNIADMQAAKPFNDMTLEDFPLLPVGWTGADKRFFPCTMDNKPMQKWGWSREYMPTLYIEADAKALSPCGWVGQNMLYQKFIVLDIDGRGHGADDQQVIEFGNQFRNTTKTMEDPAKPGSFHLYFETDRLIPVRHFPWAKLDLMGNSVNAAVYIKNKKSNGLPMRKLDGNIWQAMMYYQIDRKEQLCR